MRAIVQDRYGPPDVLQLGEVERPEPGTGEVLVRVRAAGVDPGVWHVMTGSPYVVRFLGVGLRGPKVRVRGRDLAGTVAAVGEGVTAFAAGDDVFGVGEGAFAEFAVAPEDALAPVPSNLTFEEAAAVPTSATTALQALRDAGGIDAGQSVLIIGASGGVGTFAVQLARAFGGEVTGVCSTSNLELVRSLGAGSVIDYTRHEIGEDGRRYDLIVDLAGNRSLSRLRSALAPRGTLVIVGGEAGGRWLGGVDRHLRALALSPFVSQRLRPMLASVRREDLGFLTERIEAVELAPVVDRTWSLGEVPEALRYLVGGEGRGKSVVRVG